MAVKCLDEAKSQPYGSTVGWQSTLTKPGAVTANARRRDAKPLHRKRKDMLHSARLPMLNCRPASWVAAAS